MAWMLALEARILEITKFYKADATSGRCGGLYCLHRPRQGHPRQTIPYRFILPHNRRMRHPYLHDNCWLSAPPEVATLTTGPCGRGAQ